MKFREYHLSCILKQFYGQKLPLDVFLNHYFRSHPALGSKDRRFLSETVYEKFRFEEFPTNLHHLLFQAYGDEKARALIDLCRTRAPLTIRINPLKTDREALLKKWPQGKATPDSPWGIQFSERVNFATATDFQEGLFEVQDEASQLVARLVETKPGDHVLDFCAGAGGKTLAFAPQMENRGQIYLHDIRPFALKEARKRLKRAGIQNIQFNLPSQLASMDWVIADVPCTGTGTLRRNPDLKNRFSLEVLNRLVEQQKEIFQAALAYLKRGGKIVYSTCSILPQENTDQITFFTQSYGLKVVQTFQSLPQQDGMDGFFAAVMEY
jgi:16S rRNA (cytosine967-C5)-methyltransferase